MNKVLAAVFSLFVFLTGLRFLGPARAEEEAVTAAEKRVLDSGAGYWRVFVGWKTPVLISDQGALKPLLEKKRRGQTEPGRPVPVRRSPHPPADWTGVEFDDSPWARTRTLFPGPNWRLGRDIYSEGNPAQVNVICARGKFQVVDPGKAQGLKLSVEYHGGLVVYLNGREIRRAHLPQGGLQFDTMAEPYPEDVYLRGDGDKLNEWEERDRYQKHDPQILARYAKRVRRLTDVELPADLLRTGCNVLALEVHRAPVRELYLQGTFGGKRHWSGNPSPWPHAGLLGVKLTAPLDSPVVPNLDRPEAVQVWTRNATATKVEITEFGDPCEPLQPLVVIAARGGAFSAQAVVGSTRPISGLKAEVTDLRAGDASIPAGAIEIFYPLSDGPANRWARWPPTFDTLAPRPPQKVDPAAETGAAVQPVWLKVHVPADAEPGEYSGRLEITLDGSPTLEVPVALKIHNWKLPDPKNSRTFVDMIQSPETLAIKYGVPLWSQQHFKYIERSLKLMGEAGSKAVYLRLLCKTHFGNTQSIVRFVPEPDGGYKRDYSIMDRYMDLAEKHQGKPLVVVLYCWERYTAQGMAPMVTQLDPKTGRLTEIETPEYGTPQGEAFWAPVFEEISNRMAERGLKDALMIGAFGDFNNPTPQAVEFFKKVAPGMPWVSQGHGLFSEIHGVPVGYCTTVWRRRAPEDPAKERLYGWRGQWLCAEFARDMFANAPLPEYRQLLEWNVAGGQRGVGRLGADFWEVLTEEQKSDQGGYSGGGRLAHRFPELGKWGQLVVRTNMINPGEDGALPSVRYEALREGLQDCEARIFIETALLDPALKARLGDDLARRAQQVLDQRTLMLVNGHYAAAWFFDCDFRQRCDKLYGIAAEVAEAVGQD